MSDMPQRLHPDGSVCPEGTVRLPARFKPCCSDFFSHCSACYYDIRYEWWSSRRGWFIVIADAAGGGGIAINFCPHCGARLQGRISSGRSLDLISTKTNRPKKQEDYDG
jgi:hypothetical protein